MKKKKYSQLNMEVIVDVDYMYRKNNWISQFTS